MPIGSGGTSTTARPISWRPAGGATRSASTAALPRMPRVGGRHRRPAPADPHDPMLPGTSEVETRFDPSGEAAAPAGRGHQPVMRRRCSLRSASARLPSNRRSFEPRVRRVGVRGRGARAASSRAAAIRSRHRSRLRSWLRLCESLTRSSAPSAARIRARRTSAVTTGEVDRCGHLRRARVDVLPARPAGAGERPPDAVIGTTMPSGVVRSASRSMAFGRAGDAPPILPDPRPAPPLVQGAAGRIRDSHPGSDCSSAGAVPSAQHVGARADPDQPVVVDHREVVDLLLEHAVQGGARVRWVRRRRHHP